MEAKSFSLRILMTHLFIARFKAMNTCFENVNFSLLLYLIKFKNPGEVQPLRLHI